MLVPTITTTKKLNHEKLTVKDALSSMLHPSIMHHLFQSITADSCVVATNNLDCSRVHLLSPASGIVASVVSWHLAWNFTILTHTLAMQTRPTMAGHEEGNEAVENGE